MSYRTGSQWRWLAQRPPSEGLPSAPDVLRAAYPTPVIRAYALFFASWTTSGSGLSEPQFPQLSSGIFHTIVEMTT